ncbi:LCP family protein [Tannockella kyphosi]|uniref:LCP family protein n=1 Tax=Tannockella kyphosi TaxID=2899121 RepID=UPI0020130DBD|nr:LCP family protein [Tannockella kyphosi]
MKKENIKRIMIIVQVLINSMFLYELVIFNILPTRYLIYVVAFLVLFTAFKIGIFKKGKMNRYVIVLTFITSSIVAIAGVYVYHSRMLLENMTETTIQIQGFSVVVLNDSSIEDIEGLEELSIGVNTNGDVDNLSIVIEELQEIGTTMVVYEDFTSLTNDLYDGTVDAIVFNETDRTTIEFDYPDFDDETKVIWNYEIEEEIEDISKSVEVTSEPFTIYISGIDTYGSVDTVSRSDVNMVLTINPETNQILMTSIPRDSYVELASYDSYDKLTHAGTYGISESVATIEEFLDIEINYYVKVNFTSVVDLVDALGGVTVYSEYEFTTNYLDYDIEIGLNDLDGLSALAFARERYALPNGDFDRGINQTVLLEAMIEKMISPSILLNYTDILDAVDGSFSTNMTSSEIISLLKMQIDDNDEWEFLTLQVEGTTGSATTYSYGSLELSVVFPDQEVVDTISTYIEAMMNGELIEIEE